MLKFLKRYGGVIILVLTFAALLIAARKIDGPGDTWRTLKSMDGKYTFMALACWAAFILARACTMKYYLSRQGAYVSLRRSVRASVIGLFYSGITPAASGGQPMQMYQLYKAGVPVSLSGSGVCVKFVGFQGMLLLLAALFMITERTFAVSAVGSSMWLVMLGFAINAVVMAAVTLTLINRRAVFAMARAIMKIGAKLRLIKDREAMEKKLTSSLESYLVSFSTLRGRPMFMLGMMLMSGLQVVAYSGILYCLYRAFGLSGATLWQMMGLQLILYQTVSFVPLPGASGAQEGLFILLLQSVVPASSRMGMLLAWRFFTFYLTMIAGVLTVAGGSIASIGVSAKERDSI